MKKLFVFSIHIFIILSMLLPLSAVEGIADHFGQRYEPQSISSGLFRTVVRIDQPYDLTRLDDMGIEILNQGEDQALVLVSDGQLETLARLGFEPQSSIDLGLLVEENAESLPWLASSMEAQLTQAYNLTRERTESTEENLEIEEQLVAAIEGFSIEQLSALQSLPGIDSDADGLTDTQESWWCTDPMNPDSDGDGVTDGTEVIYIKDWVSNHGHAVPTAGKPFVGWPNDHPGCYDDDYDSVPDMAERWELGLNMNRESTDGDKFDDGQELFGLTMYPGYGGLPRPEDTFITSSMPGWVDPPGNSPVVAAYPQISIDIIPNSIEINLVTEITTGETHGTGETFGYSTTNSKGTSTGVGKEESHTSSGWQEIGNTEADSFEQSTYQSTMESHSHQYTVEHSIGTAHEEEKGGSKVVTTGSDVSYGAAASLDWDAGVDLGFPKIVGVSHNWGTSESLSKGHGYSQSRSTGDSWSDRDSTTEQTTTGESCGTEIAHETGEEYTIGRVHEISQVVGAGYENSQATTFTREDYNEFAVTNDHQIASSQEWSTATAVDSSHVADLTFTYQIQNSGADNARVIQNILLNIYIDGVRNPISSYAGVLVGDSCSQLSVTNLYPGDFFPETGAVTQCAIPLNLDQVEKIDQGASVRVVVVDYSYGDDEQFYENAWGQGVIVEIDDDTWDGDEEIDNYLIPTWGVETFQDVVWRYFLGTETINGDLLTIFTPEYNEHHEITGWNEYAVTDRSWWNIYLSDYGDDINSRFKDKIAIPETRILMRFNKDTDLDYYSDRVERDYNTSLINQDEHPNAALVAGYTNTRQGDQVQVELALENFGNFDAFGVEATMFALDNSITINVPIVGMAGLIPSGEKILLSSRILEPDTSLWQGTAFPITGGHFTGLVDNTITFQANMTGEIGITSGLALEWVDSNGLTGSILVGLDYSPPAKQPVLEGILLGINSGSVVAGEYFSITALSPKDVLKYTINEEPYTPPVIVVSYNDPSGNKEFSDPVNLVNIDDDLLPYIDYMSAAPELILESTTNFNPASDNQVVLTFINPRNESIENGSLYIGYAESITGNVVALHQISTTFSPGPNLFLDTWNVNEFDPAYDPDKEYKVKAFAVDSQGVGIDVAFSQFVDMGQSQPAQISLNSAAWNFGSAFKGDQLTSELVFANVGFSKLWAWTGTGNPSSLRQSSSLHQLEPGEMEVIPLSLDTSSLPIGEYNGTLTLRTNDPDNAIVDIAITGTILDPVNGVNAQADPYQPLNETLHITGPLTANTVLTYTPSDEVIETAEPILFADDLGNVVGMGESFLDYDPGTIPLSGGSPPDFLDNWLSSDIDLSGAVELEEYRTEDSSVYVWPDGHGIAVSKLPDREIDPEQPEDSSNGSVKYDTYVNAYYPSATNTTESRLYIGNFPTYWKSNARTLIRFNLPSLPTYSEIDSAQFRLYAYSWYGTNTIATQVYRIKGSWSESSYPTWNSQPSIDWNKVWSTANVAKSTGWKYWTITSLVEAWYNGTTNNGLMLRANPENSNSVVFYSKESSTDPLLIVNFHMTPPPSAPTLYSISNADADGNYQVDWSTVANTTSYQLQQSVNGGSYSLIYSGTSSAYNVSGRSPGSYCYRVRAVNAYGSSSYSATKCTTVNPPPNTPVINTISNMDGNGDYTVDWNDISIAVSYELQENHNDGTFSTIYSAANSSYAVTGRTSGNWCYRAKAINASGSSDWSSIQCAIVNLAPNVPVNLLPADGTSQLGRSVTFSWQDSGDDDGYPGTPMAYRVEIKSLETGEVVQISDWITTTQWTTVLPDDGVYAWRVEASDSLSTSGWSGYQDITVFSIARGADLQINLALPTDVTESIAYHVRYGVPAEFITALTPQTITINLPKRLYSSVTFDMLVNASSSSVANFTVDVGDDGSIDWTQSLSWDSPSILGSPNLASAVNNYMAQSTAVGGESVPILISINFDSTGELYITNVHSMTAVDSDPMVGVGDLTIDNADPVETEEVILAARVHNAGIYTAKNVMVNYFVGNPQEGGKYIGGKLVPSILADNYVDTNLMWNTSGYTGAHEIYAVVDIASQIPEMDEENNTTSLSVSILTRPDLLNTAIQLSDDEPVVGETIIISLTETNQGQADSLPSVVSVFDSDPNDGGLLLGESTIEVMGESSTNLDFEWLPDQTGWHRIYIISDMNDQISEYDEGNNQNWLDVYVGFEGPLLLDSGTATDQVYSPETGFGYIDINLPDELVVCGAGSLPEETMRRDPDGEVVYQFDHLQPGHFYHLDLILYECDGAGRQETIYVDDYQVSEAQDLGDGQVHRLSIRLDPALYSDRTISVSIKAAGIDGAVVSAVNLHDIDYRYADSGGGNDPEYPVEGDYGWMDGSPLTTWGTLPYQSVRVDQSDNEVCYKFDNLDPTKSYNVHFTFWQPSSTARIQKVQIDGLDTSLTVNTGDYLKHQESVGVLSNAYATDGEIVVSVVRTNATTGAMVNEIALEEETISANAGCVVQETPYFSETYGNVLINDVVAPSGSVVQAISPRGDTVGCFTVSDEGLYGFMRIYGEDTSAEPPIPGMRAGEIVSFRVNGAPAIATPTFYWNDDHVSHNIDLNAGNLSGQSILLQPGWNLISFKVEPPVSLVSSILQSVDGRYDRVLGENGIYSPSLPDTFNTLKELHSAAGYYLRVNDTSSVSLLVEGLDQSCSTPKELHAGWNWIGAPCEVTPTATALQSIDGFYQRILSLNKTYDPALPEFSTLDNLTPGEGYLIYITEPVTLIYPDVTGQGGEDVVTRSDPCGHVSPTPFATIIYGQITINGDAAPSGAIVEVVTPRGEIAGCGVTIDDGLLPFTQVFGADEEGIIGGFFEGEELVLRINGIDDPEHPDFLWQDDKDSHWIEASTEIELNHNIYFPILSH